MSRLCFLTILSSCMYAEGTLGDDAASLKRWVNHMSTHLTLALEERKVPLDEIQSNVQVFYQTIGWDDRIGRLVPSAPLAAGTWEEQVEQCSTLFSNHCGLPPTTAQEWHDQVSTLHAADPPIIDNLREMIQTCHNFGMKVAVCTSDDRIPTNVALENWGITDLIDVRRTTKRVYVVARTHTSTHSLFFYLV